LAIKGRKREKDLSIDLDGGNSKKKKFMGICLGSTTEERKKRPAN